jgi:hypothetical protein
MAGRVVPLRLTSSQAERIIRQLATDSAKVVVTGHAQDRMEERGFSDHDLFAVLRSGMVVGWPERTPESEWKCKVVKRITGHREAGVITVIAKGDLLIIVTMEWEDTQ